MPLLSPPRPPESTDVATSLRSRVPLWAPAASLATAGGIHLAVGYEHDFAGLHGTFFAVAGIIQVVGAAVVARRPDRWFLGLAMVGSAALLVTWLLERTPGLPGGDSLDPLAVATAVASSSPSSRPSACSRGRSPPPAASGASPPSVWPRSWLWAAAGTPTMDMATTTPARTKPWSPTGRRTCRTASRGSCVRSRWRQPAATTTTRTPHPTAIDAGEPPARGGYAAARFLVQSVRTDPATEILATNDSPRLSRHPGYSNSRVITCPDVTNRSAAMRPESSSSSSTKICDPGRYSVSSSRPGLNQTCSRLAAA